MELFKDFLGSDQYKIYSLAGDASTRKYYRLIQNDRSWVIMSWEPFVAEKYPFLSVLEHFAKHHVHVPQVHAVYAAEGMIVLEDLGDLTLERKALENQVFANSREFYSLAIDELIKIHGGATEFPDSQCTAFQIQFDTEKFMWELNYAVENLVEGVLKFKFEPKYKEEIYALFKDLCQRLDREPKRIAHRDYHSRNVMLKLDQLKVIDFQDARLGPVQYDLVSLLKDSYVDIPEDFARSLLSEYIAKAQGYLPKSFSRDHFDEIYELQSIQRCFKACGSFASFYHQREDKRYLKYLSPTLKKVIKSLSLFPQYKPFLDLIIDSGALDKVYENL